MGDRCACYVRGVDAVLDPGQDKVQVRVKEAVRESSVAAFPEGVGERAYEEGRFAEACIVWT